LHAICGMLTLFVYYGWRLFVKRLMTKLRTMKTLILLAVLFLSACTLPQVIYVEQPPDAAFWNMPASQRWVSDPQPFPQAPRIPRWCVDPISHTNVPC